MWITLCSIGLWDNEDMGGPSGSRSFVPSTDLIKERLRLVFCFFNKRKLSFCIIMLWNYFVDIHRNLTILSISFRSWDSTTDTWCNGKWRDCPRRSGWPPLISIVPIVRLTVLWIKEVLLLARLSLVKILNALPEATSNDFCLFCQFLLSCFCVCPNCINQT